MTKHENRNQGLLRWGAASAIGAAAVNAVIFGIGRAVGVSFTYVDGTKHDTIQLGTILAMSLIMFGVGLVAAAIAARVGRPSLRVFQVLGGALALLSLVGLPAMVATVGTKSSLAAMHLVVGIAYVGSLEVVRYRNRQARPALPTTQRTDEAALAY